MPALRLLKGCAPPGLLSIPGRWLVKFPVSQLARRHLPFAIICRFRISNPLLSLRGGVLDVPCISKRTHTSGIRVPSFPSHHRLEPQTTATNPAPGLVSYAFDLCRMCWYKRACIGTASKQRGIAFTEHAAPLAERVVCSARAPRISSRGASAAESAIGMFPSSRSLSYKLTPLHG